MTSDSMSISAEPVTEIVSARAFTSKNPYVAIAPVKMSAAPRMAAGRVKELRSMREKWKLMGTKAYHFSDWFTMNEAPRGAGSNGADGETRTLTGLLPHAPEACASTHSAPSARHS